MANEAAAESQAIKYECETELDAAIPALESAIQALNTLKPSDISLVKSMKVNLRGDAIIDTCTAYIFLFDSN